MTMTFAEKYAVLGTRDTQFEGVFITAVKSTGIFCRPSCRARKPLAKNVEFFDSAETALKNGYRPCKVCRPMDVDFDTPDFIRSLIDELQTDPSTRITDADLVAKGMEPNTIRRWFKRHHHMTFQAYQRLLRINLGFDHIKSGMTVTNTAFASGYESLSGFQDGFRTVFGETPSAATGKTVIHLERFATELGPMFVGATEEGVCLLEFTDRRMLETEFQDLKKRLKATYVPGTNEHSQLAKEQISEYFAGKRTEFTVPLHTPGTEFQIQVWDQLRSIPYGKTRSYAEQAVAIGNPSAVRAVARANGMNRIAIIIPCHRVIGSDGSLTGYAGGLARKQWLLDHEAKHT